MSKTILIEEFKLMADKHLADYMGEAKKKNIDPEKAVGGMLLSIVTQIEHKHGKAAAYKIISNFIEDYSAENKVVG